MSYIGFYRYKITPSANQNVEMYIDNILTSTKSIEVRAYCDESKRLKFLNKDGQYRFATFNRFYETKDKPKEIGRANKIISSLLSSQSDTESIGYKNDKTISLTADDISQTELLVLKDLWTSPRVFLYVGDGVTDTEEDYIQVEVKVKNPINRISKGSFIDIKLDVILPRHYTINML